MLQREQRLLSPWYAVRHLSKRRDAARRRRIRRFREKQQKERLLFITILVLIVCRSFLFHVPPFLRFSILVTRENVGVVDVGSGQLYRVSSHIRIYTSANGH